MAQEGEGSITGIADYESNTPFAVVETSNGFSVVYYGGPTRGWMHTPATYSGTAVSTYSGNYRGNTALLAALIPPSGKMLLTSPHYEAYEGIGITGFSTTDRRRSYIWLSGQLNRIMGTGYTVPTLEEAEKKEGFPASAASQDRCSVAAWMVVLVVFAVTQ